MWLKANSSFGLWISIASCIAGTTRGQRLLGLSAYGEMRVIKPFHLSFPVSNLKQTVDFYVEILGGKVRQDAGSWIDIIFFGHQLTVHQAQDEDSPRPIDHFGPVLDKNEWLDISKKISSSGIAFVMSPTIRSEGLDLESGKFIIQDPAGNFIEFKFNIDHQSQG